jgi:hypothetical protein
MEIDLIRQRDQIHARDITRVGEIIDREAKMTRDLDPIIGKEDIREVEVGAGVLRQQGEEIYRIGDLPSLHLIPSPHCSSPSVSPPAPPSSTRINDHENEQLQRILERIPSPEEIEDEIALLVSHAIKYRVDQEGSLPSIPFHADQEFAFSAEIFAE